MSTITTDANDANFKAWSLLNPPEDSYTKLKRMNAENTERRQKMAYVKSKETETPMTTGTPMTTTDPDTATLALAEMRAQHEEYIRDSNATITDICAKYHSRGLEISALKTKLAAERAIKSPIDRKLLRG